MPAPQIILDLIDRFERNLDDYKSGAYNETQVRREFIDPFFEALGWDVNNKDGNAEAYKDVIHEDAVKVSGVTKAPDYSFRIGGQRKFFVEAKKPSVNIKDAPAAAFQVRRYAWSAKLPLSIVSDFEELAVYDCRIKPDQNDKADKARIKYYTYRQYAEKWDEIAAIFSKDAILKGSFDKYAESNKTKRGTAEVDSAFLAEIENWREMLARNIALRNSLTVRELNDSVQRIIDRIIFLRIAEDRGIEDYGALRGICNGNNTYGRLQELFYKADDRYNSGLFHFRQERDETEPPDKLTTTLSIDDKPLKDILKTLYYPDSPYEFAVLPADILGQVYEQFLGKVIRLTSDHRAVVEDKPEVKKAGGVFYTPTYIVEYIVKNTVGKLLEGKTPKKVDGLRILDPACGSGSFLLGAYQYLLDWHLKWYGENEPGKWAKAKRPALYQGQGGAWHLTTTERKRILLNNIYGVDIDSQAVEVTKLSLLLKVLEDETDETLNRQRKLFHERALPNLGGNIKCGNSLIGPDFYDGKQMNMLDTEEAQRVNVFDWQAEFPEIFKAGGFDAVIGNPPYVRQELLVETKVHFQQHYKTYHGVADLYVYFIEKGVNLLKNGGIYSVIVANKWMKTTYGEPLRLWMKAQHIDEITDFVDMPIFKGATTYTCILRIIKHEPHDSFMATQVANIDFPSLSDYVSVNHYPVSLKALDDKGWLLAKEGTQYLQTRLQSMGVPLKEFVKGKVYRGVLTGLNEAFVIDKETRDHLIAEDPKSAEVIKPFLVGKDIKRYQPIQCNRFVIFTRRGIDIRQYPAIEKNLSAFKSRLMPKPKDWEGVPNDKKWLGRKPGPYQWYEIQDTVEYFAEFDEVKILWPGISAEVTAFTLDEAGYYGNDNNQLIVSGDRYLLGILNSRLTRFLLSNICDKVQGGFYRLKIVYVQQLPIHTIDFDKPDEKKKHDWMVTLVEQMLALHKQLPEAKTGHEQTLIQRQIDATDKQIDKLVYELYELTPEEIAIVEKNEKSGDTMIKLQESQIRGEYEL
jgi:predicted type IV restriction endonuclease